MHTVFKKFLPCYRHGRKYTVNKRKKSCKYSGAANDNNYIHELVTRYSVRNDAKTNQLKKRSYGKPAYSVDRSEIHCRHKITSEAGKHIKILNSQELCFSSFLSQ